MKPNGTNGHHRDAGSPERELREKPCSIRTWCILVDGHTGNCVEIPRASHKPPNFGPKR